MLEELGEVLPRVGAMGDWVKEIFSKKFGEMAEELGVSGRGLGSDER